MPIDYMENERQRWSYMTTSQLRTRLRRITKREKLNAFIAMARERENATLERLGNSRAIDLGFVDTIRFVPHPLTTVTGRSVSSRPNMQEIPVPLTRRSESAITREEPVLAMRSEPARTREIITNATNVTAFVNALLAAEEEGRRSELTAPTIETEPEPISDTPEVPVSHVTAHVAPSKDYDFVNKEGVELPF